jgi:hypothetical protein
MFIFVPTTGVGFNITWVERFNVQGLPAFGGAGGDQDSGLMSLNRLNPKELCLHRGGK